jgi:hypothetical protein
VSGIVFARLRYHFQPQRTHVASSHGGDTRPFVKAASDQFQQPLWYRYVQSCHGNPGLASVVAKLEVGAGNPRAGRLPQRSTGNVPEKDFVVRNLTHFPPFGSRSCGQQLAQFVEKTGMDHCAIAGREFSGLGVPSGLIEMKECERLIRTYLNFVLQLGSFPFN